jgi:glucan endo-1,3-alpha-glucosidase
MSNDHLYNKRWETIITNRSSIDIVQIITWNDYGESHYIGPIEGDQPNSQDWVDGFDHTAWLDMTTYYATAFKTGSFPEITEDKIYLWSRPHPRDATASSDPVGKPQSFQLLEDVVFAVVMATSPSKVTLSTGPSSSQTFDVPSGVTKLTIPISGGGTMYGKIERGGNIIVELDPDFTFNPNPTTYNYNAMVAFAGNNQTTTPPVGGNPNNTSSSTVSSSSVSSVPASTPSPSPSSSSRGPVSQSTPTPSPSPTRLDSEIGGYRVKRHYRRLSH